MQLIETISCWLISIMSWLKLDKWIKKNTKEMCDEWRLSYEDHYDDTYNDTGSQCSPDEWIYVNTHQYYDWIFWEFLACDTTKSYVTNKTSLHPCFEIFIFNYLFKLTIISLTWMHNRDIHGLYKCDENKNTEENTYWNCSHSYIWIHSLFSSLNRIRFFILHSN